MDGQNWSGVLIVWTGRGYKMKGERNMGNPREILLNLHFELCGEDDTNKKSEMELIVDILESLNRAIEKMEDHGHTF